MSTYEKNWEGEFRTNQTTFSPMHGTENSQSNNNEFVGSDLGDVTWQTECKVGFSGVATRDNSSGGFTFNMYNGPEKEPLYR